MSNTVALALGSNVGNRLAALENAIAALSARGFHITAKSRVWETEPWGLVDQPPFLNMCLLAETELEPLETLRAVKDIEERLGRKERRRWGPREIDIDIIMAGETTLSSPELTIPHPLMHERAFVLVPLSEIAPDALHPLLKKSVSELLAALPAEKMTWIIQL